MSDQTITPINNDVRYDIKLSYYKENSYVVYQIKILDLAMGREYQLLHRFSQIKKFHEDLIKKLKIQKDKLPEFPKTNSVGFWHRTNRNDKMIENRKRELEFYFTKLLNHPQFRGLNQVKYLMKSAKERRRTKSMILSYKYKIEKEEKQQQQKQQKLQRFHSLSQLSPSHFSKSNHHEN